MGMRWVGRMFLSFRAWLILASGLLMGFSFFTSGPTADPDEYWTVKPDATDAQPDHSLWQAVLDDYLVADESGVNLVDYEGIKSENDPRLGLYTRSLAEMDPRRLPRAAQMAYWINLYNALTVSLVVESYPVESITDIGESLFSRGPWDDEQIQIAKRTLTLNDIEHRILRPIFNDYRIHFAVNCASIGCPNLSPLAFTAENLDQQLNRLTKEFLAHSRGVQYRDGKLLLSSIFEWYADDFGRDEKELLQTLAKHVEPSLSEVLQSYDEDIEFAYDWRLNGL